MMLTNNKKTIPWKKVFYAIQFAIGPLFIFYQLLPAPLVAVVAAVYIVASFWIMKKSHDSFSSLAIACVVSIPISFISVLGGTTNSFPLALFHIIVMSLTFISLLKKGNLTYLLMVLAFATLGFAISAQNELFVDGMKQTIGILFCILSFFIGSALKRNIGHDNEELFFDFINTFIATCLVVVAQLAIQFFVHRLLGIELGHMIVYNQRTAYGALMGDYSFVTLYLACGILLLFLLWSRYKRISFFTFVLLGLALVTGTLITSARTGLAALLITFVLYFLFTEKRFSIKTLILIPFAIGAIIVVLYSMKGLRGEQSLLDSSGRVENYSKAFAIFLEHPLFGVGLGLTELKNQTGLDVPHNFFIQYLCQIGLTGTFLICLPFIVYISKELRTSKCIKWVFILIFIGSMLIPDITSSRFLFAIIVISFSEPARTEASTIKNVAYRKFVIEG